MDVTYLQSVTSLTGGGLDALDGVRTITRDVPQYFFVCIGLSSQQWILMNGDDETDVAAGIVRPVDHSEINRKVFKRVG